MVIKKQLAVSSCFTRDKDTLENTNSIILPKDFLEKIINKKIDKYFFKITNNKLGIITYASVMEFSAPDKTVILPYWLMEYLAVDENSKLEIELVTNIIKGSKVILEPLDKEFFNIPESDVILESVLSKFSLLQYNSVIKVDIMDKKYLIKIKDISHDYSEMFNIDNETKSQDDLMNINMDVIDIINVDLEVELYNGFLAKELAEKEKQEKIRKEQEEEEKIIRQIKIQEELDRKKNDKEYQKKLAEDKKKRQDNIKKYGNSSKFIPFSGKGHRLGD